MSRRHARRAVTRWGWRLLRRDWRQQVLILLLLVVAVGAAVTGSAMAVNSQHDETGYFGDADTVIGLSGLDPTTAQASLADIAQRFGAIEVVRHSVIEVPGSSARLDRRGQVPNGPFAGGKLSLLEGAYPTGAGEVALTDGAADVLGAGIGDSVPIEGSTRLVVGLVEDPHALDDEFVLAVPDESEPVDFIDAYVVAGVDGLDSLPDGGLPGQLRAMTRHDARDTSTAVIVVLAVTVVLSLVGLVAAAGFTVTAHRRQRQLGMLAAIGGSDRDLRRVMAVNGFVVGTIASAVGIAGGVIGWLVMRPVTERAAGQRRDALDVPWFTVTVAGILAVAIATAAAWWPARQVSRLAVVGALSGRPAPQRPVHRSIVVAAVLLATGVVLVSIADPGSDEVEPILLSLGLIAVICGVVFVAPAAVRAIGAIAHRLPLAPRLALRDLARHQARAASSLAAITLGLGMAVSIVAVAAASEMPASEGNLAANQLLIEPNDMRQPPAPERTAGDEARLDDAADSVVAVLGPDASAVALDVMVDPDATGSEREPVAVVELGTEATDGAETIAEFFGWAYVARADVLAHFAIDPAAVESPTDLLLAEDRPVGLVVGGPRSSAVTPAETVQVVDLPAHSSAPFALVPERVMAARGWEAIRAAWFVELPAAVSGDRLDAARQAAAAAGLSVTVRDTEDTLADIGRWTTVGGAALALAIVAMAVGMIRAESAGDIRTLTATGASGRTRRALTASTASALASLGALLGVGGAYVFLVAMYRTELDVLTPLPIRPLLTLVLGLPMTAAIGGWLLAGREPTTFARRSLD